MTPSSRIVESVDVAPAQDAGLEGAAPEMAVRADGMADKLLGEALLGSLWREACAAAFALDQGEFAEALRRTAEKCHFNLPLETAVTAFTAESFWRGLRLRELALAQACALGREQAWRAFLAEFREPLTRAAVAITGSSGQGEELADSLYSELYGVDGRGGVRRSPLLSYAGRGSLLAWLRTTLAQRHVDQYRRTHREAPLADQDFPAAEPAEAPEEPSLVALNGAMVTTLKTLGAEERFMLSAWFLDGQTQQQIARLLRVHEATVSRRLKQLIGKLRKDLLRNLRAGGMSRRAAEEALGTDPRDLSINLRTLLQTSHSSPFQGQATDRAAKAT